MMHGQKNIKLSLGRRKRELDGNIKMDLQGEEWVYMDLIDLVVDIDGLMNAVMKLRFT